MWRQVIVAALLIVAFGLVSHAQDSAHASSGAVITYEKFMALSSEQREDRFRTLSPENKASLKRTHAENWLTRNRGDLTQDQIAAVAAGIAFISPDLYRHAPDAEARKKDDEIKMRLTCSLGRKRVTAAFTFFETSGKSGAMDAIDEWLSWFTDCVLK